MKRLKKIIIISVMFFGFVQLAFSQDITISSLGIIKNNTNKILLFDVTYNGGKTYKNVPLCPGKSTDNFFKPTKVSNIRDVTNNSSYKVLCK